MKFPVPPGIGVLVSAILVNVKPMGAASAAGTAMTRAAPHPITATAAAATRTNLPNLF